MNASIVEVSAVALTETTEKVNELTVQVAVLADRNQRVFEALNRLELTLEKQASATTDYRDLAQQQIQEVMQNVRAVETQVAQVVEDVKKLTSRSVADWFRRNMPVITGLIVIGSLLFAILKWWLDHR